MRLFSGEARREQLRAEVALVHAAMASDPGPVGKLARLFDRLQVVAPRSELLTADTLFTYERRRIMYIGGVAFTAQLDEDRAANVAIRRSTMHHSGREDHAEMSIFVTGDTQSRIRARLYTHHRHHGWRAEGSVAYPGPGYLSSKAPELTRMDVMDRLVGEVTRLAISVCPEVAQRELPGASPPSAAGAVNLLPHNPNLIQ
jgi:hypothetical protein